MSQISGHITIACNESDDLVTGGVKLITYEFVPTRFFRSGVEVSVYRSLSERSSWKRSGPCNLTVACEICEFEETVLVPSLPKGFRIFPYTYSVTWDCCVSRNRDE